MNEFFQEHRTLILSSLYLLAGIMAAGYSVFLHGIGNNGKLLISSINKLNQENDSLKSSLLDINSKNKLHGNKISSTPSFLENINTVAKNNKVLIRRLTPSQNDQLKYELETILDYFAFLRFTASLEGLNIIINDMQIRPYNATKVPPLHLISFSITPKNDAAPLSDKRLENLRTAKVKAAKRNPFQRYAFDKNKKVVQQDIDLTWIYKLTGIGRSDGKSTATIDRREYFKGGSLDGMIITKIDGKKVRFRNNNNETFVLKFRARSKK